jgi:cytochrome c peroxidase
MSAGRAARAAGRWVVALVVLALALAPACADSPNAPPASAALLAAVLPTGFGAATPADTAPPDNALTEARAALGRRLFNDARLSSTGQVSCASCHQQADAFSDPARVSTGVDGQRGTRNAPALVNLAWGTSFFWDGRAASLEEQAGKPIENPIEMNLPLADAVAHVATDTAYVSAFADAYAGPPTETTLRYALASFVRALVSGGSPYDRHERGDDGAFGAAEARGEALFFSERTGCFHCHPPGALTNDGYFNDGSFVAGGDEGRKALTGLAGDLGKFKVPGLRDVAASAPYMHDGSLSTLEAVIDQYDRGGRGDPSTDPQVRPLGLSAGEKGDLVTFLRSLTDGAFLADARYRLP